MDGVTRDPLDHVMAVMPNNAANVNEFVLLEMGVNTAKMGMWGEAAIHTDDTADSYRQSQADRAIKSVKDVIAAMKYMQDPVIHQRLEAQKQHIAARLKQLDEVEMPRFQKHTGDDRWHRWTSRGLEGEWNTWVRTRAAVAKTKGVNYIEWMIRELKLAYAESTARSPAR